MSDSKVEHVKDLLHDFKTVMMVTHLPKGQNHVRPMQIADTTKDGAVRFATSVQSPKVDEISKNHDVTLVFQNATSFMSLHGTAKIEQDKNLVHELWSEAWRVWFPKGKDDPEICIITVMPQEAEFWDNSGSNGLKYAFEAAKAYVQGKKPESDASVHGKVTM